MTGTDIPKPSTPARGRHRLRRSRLVGVVAAAGVTVLAGGLLATGGMRAAPQAKADTGVSITTTAYQASNSVQLVDVYTPTRAGPGPFPGILFVHGGGWNSGDRSELAAEAVAAAQHGYVGFAIDYSLAAPHFPTEVRDVDAAISQARANAAALHLDPTRLAGWGDSAGANLILEAATADHQDLQAVVGWSGPYNLLTTLDQQPAAASLLSGYLGCDITTPACRTGPAAAASPALHVAPSDPPTYLVNSTDEIVPAAQLTEMQLALQAAGVPVRTLLLPGTRHATAYAADATTPTLAFLDTYLHPLATQASADPVTAY